MFTYEEAKKFAVDNLLRDAELHEAGDYQRVGKNFDEYDTELPRTDDSRFTKLKHRSELLGWVARLTKPRLAFLRRH
jgi:hypothetical protein